MLFAAVGMLTGCGKNNVTIADLKDTEVEKYVTLSDYRNLEIVKPRKVEVTDAYVKRYVNGKIDRVSEMHELIGTVENGDVVNIDYAGTIDGTAFQGGTAQGQLLEIGSGSFIAGFEEGLIGAEVGDTRELDLRFPEDYDHAEVAGKECVFAVTINYILTELTDENVSLVDAGYQSAALYREDAEKMLTEMNEEQYDKALENAIAASLIAGCTFEEVPVSLVEDYKVNLQTEYENIAAALGMTFEEYMAGAYQVAADSIDDEMAAIALRCAKEGLAVQAIADAEGITVSEEELDAVMADYTAAVSAEEDLNREIVRVNLLYEKVYDVLKDIYRK